MKPSNALMSLGLGAIAITMAAAVTGPAQAAGLVPTTFVRTSPFW